ncbi:MAG TPA: response regulator [Sphingorhabdus sp.]|nr:response regulator [Sphingorhabdus sp.]
MTANSERRLKILLVDDEMLVRSGTAMMLDELGHEVTEARSAKEALLLIVDASPFDLVITDYRMPDMDGAAMIAEARKQRPDLRAVLMTGYDADDPRFDGIDCPNLAKPFGLEELEQAIAAAFRAD